MSQFSVDVKRSFRTLIAAQNHPERAASPARLWTCWIQNRPASCNMKGLGSVHDVCSAFRFMATNDLMTELQKDSIKLDDDSERKVGLPALPGSHYAFVLWNSN